MSIKSLEVAPKNRVGRTTGYTVNFFEWPYYSPVSLFSITVQIFPSEKKFKISFTCNNNILFSALK